MRVSFFLCVSLAMLGKGINDDQVSRHHISIKLHWHKKFEFKCDLLKRQNIDSRIRNFSDMGLSVEYF